MQGIVDAVTSEFTALTVTAGAGSKDGVCASPPAGHKILHGSPSSRPVSLQDSERDLELLSIVNSNRGSKVHVTVRDNAAIGKNGEYLSGFAAELCDRKLFDVNINLYFFEQHGKCDVDKLFGVIEWLLNHSNLFSADQARLLVLGQQACLCH